ncbi:Telomerase Cajal body protein 1 [Lobosporangium transversale]|nr:Telomerase Cajal body protein 1 [Lobosporangium transversale]
MIQIFDTARPGRDSVKRPTVPTRKSKEGQKGVISCLAFNPDHSDVYAAGSYLKTIGLYDARAEELIILLRDNHKKKEKPGYFHSSPMGGVTQVRFSPDGQYLYSASRQDPLIRCWDTRNTADVVYCLERPGELTNQRISFDISSDGRWLTTGDMNGDISIFDLRGLDRPMSSTTKIATTTTTTRGKAAEMTSDIILTNAGDEDGYDGVNEENKINDRLVSRLHVHDDVVSAATFHPSGALLATCSGQRKYELLFHSLDSSSDASDVEEGGERELGNQKTEKKGVAAQDSKGSEGPGTPPVKTVSYIDNSIRLWTLPGDYVWYVDGQRWSESTSISAMDATMPVSPSPSYPVSQ